MEKSHHGFRFLFVWLFEFNRPKDWEDSEKVPIFLLEKILSLSHLKEGVWRCNRKNKDLEPLDKAAIMRGLKKREKFYSQNQNTMYKKIFLAIVVFSAVCGCGNRITSSKLSKIDSLVSAEKYDSAYHEMNKINPQSINSPEERAYYNLLLTQTSILTYNPYPPDSLIDFSISFYEKKVDKKKLCDSYYYKAIYLNNKGKYSESILLCKKAEELASQINSSYHQMKITDCIAYINGMCGNYDMQLQYAKESLRHALETKRKDCIVTSYNRMCSAFQFMNEVDSAIVYANKLAGLLNEADQEELPYFLNTIGFSYLNTDNEKAKYYFEKSLSCKPLARTYENLAWIYHQEGNEEKAYELWKQALTTEDYAPHDKILYNILRYNLTHNNIDDACKQLYDMASIKDSLNNVLKDRTIQKIQQEYDEKKTEEEHQREILNWIVAALILVIVILLLLGYIRYKRYKAKIRLTEHQMLINSYQNEINLLKGQNEGNEQQIADFNKKINDLIEQESPRLYKGKMLYDQVMHNGTTITWTQDDFKCFIDFYKANYFSSYTRMIRKYQPKTVHNTFFLLLYELGKDDKDIRQILNISQEAIRSKRFRINKNLNRKQ